jgi:hypothetical protein
VPSPAPERRREEEGGAAEVRTEEEAEAPPKPGLIARLFGRGA